MEYEEFKGLVGKVGGVEATEPLKDQNIESHFKLFYSEINTDNLTMDQAKKYIASYTYGTISGMAQANNTQIREQLSLTEIETAKHDTRKTG